MIIGLPFTVVVSSDISSHLAKNHERLNGLDFTCQDEIQEGRFDFKDEVPGASKLRRVQSAT